MHSTETVVVYKNKKPTTIKKNSPEYEQHLKRSAATAKGWIKRRKSNDVTITIVTPSGKKKWSELSAIDRMFLYDTPYLSEGSKKDKREEWRWSFLHQASYAAALEAYWTKTFGRKWKKYETTREMEALATQAIETWQRLLDHVRRHIEEN